VRNDAECDSLHELQDAIRLSLLAGGSFPELDLARWDVPAMRQISNPIAIFEHADPYIALNGWP
jgi:hypothetical protein